jgi:anti-sigma-K factor RskA
MTEESRVVALSVFAGEVVLGTAGPYERAAILERFAGDPEFEAEMRAWERRLSPLADLVAPVEPSPDVWVRIEAEMARAPEPPLPREARPDDAVVVSLEEALAARTRLLQARVIRWRWATAAATALAACLALAVVLAPRGGLAPNAGQRFVGVVNSSGELPPLLVSIDLGKGELSVQPVGMAPQAGKSFELWALPPNAKPVSLGLVSQADRRPIAALAPAVWRDPSMRLAVSVEPEGGSPTGQPTGQVVYTGRLLPAE